jgi:spoIIIJ-associated protein
MPVSDDVRTETDTRSEPATETAAGNDIDDTGTPTDTHSMQGSAEASAEASAEDTAENTAEGAAEGAAEHSDSASGPDGRTGSGGTGSGNDAGLLRQLETEGDAAADFLEDLLDIADLDGDIDLDVDNGRASVSIVGGDLGVLVGQDGSVLEALQELTRLAVLRETGERSRLMLDVAGHRAARRRALEAEATEAADEVRSSGEPLRLAPMTPFERKVVHDAVAAAGLRSESEGEEPQRRVVVLPAS